MNVSANGNKQIGAKGTRASVTTHTSIRTAAFALAALWQRFTSTRSRDRLLHRRIAHRRGRCDALRRQRAVYASIYLNNQLRASIDSSQQQYESTPASDGSRGRRDAPTAGATRPGAAGARLRAASARPRHEPGRHRPSRGRFGGRRAWCHARRARQVSPRVRRGHGQDVPTRVAAPQIHRPDGARITPPRHAAVALRSCRQG